MQPLFCINNIPNKIFLLTKIKLNFSNPLKGSNNGHAQIVNFLQYIKKNSNFYFEGSLYMCKYITPKEIFMRILGKPEKTIRGIEHNPIYRAAYKACMHAGRNQTKATAKQYDKIAQLGLEDPTKTKIIMATAKKDYLKDIADLSKNDLGQIAERQINTIKTNFKLKFNLMFRRSQNALDNALKEQHPETYKLRKKLLESGNVTLENKTRPFARLGRMNIDPMKL